MDASGEGSSGRSRSGDPKAWRDHDHDVEAAVAEAFADPTPQKQHEAEVAVALLQRRYDHVLRRPNGGDGNPPPYPFHHHNAAEHPADCLDATLDELAGAVLDDRAAVLAHGRVAARALSQQVEDARRLARVLWDLLPESQRSRVDPDEFLWTPLTAGTRDGDG